MEQNSTIIQKDNIKNKIYTIRGIQVMLDSDLADLYQVNVKRLNEQVRRNFERFPEKFMFKLTPSEERILKSQFATSSYELDLRSQIATSKWGGKRKGSLAFTEQGVAMLSGILRSKTAIEISIKIINSFVSMRKFIKNNANLFHRIDKIETNQIEYQLDSNKKFERLFTALENNQLSKKQGIFFNGQVFDAYKFISELIRSAKKEIVIIDNYIDESVLTHLSKRNKDVKVKIYTKNITSELKLDLNKFNTQYSTNKNTIKLHKFSDSHDRFLIIDKSEIYHIGASLKDLGKKWFAFSKLDGKNVNILERLKK